MPSMMFPEEFMDVVQVVHYARIAELVLSVVVAFGAAYFFFRWLRHHRVVVSR